MGPIRNLISDRFFPVFGLKIKGIEKMNKNIFKGEEYIEKI